MKELLTDVTEFAVVVIDAMALLIVIVGTVLTFVAAIRAVFSRPSDHERREIWLGYARWLVAGLTFQLAADIVESSITQSWEAVARLAAVAVVRTFLNYFLERDMSELRQQQRTTRAPAPAE